MKEIIYKLLPIYKFIYHTCFSARQFVYMKILKLKLRDLGDNTQIYSLEMSEPYNVSIGHHVYINKNCIITTTSSKVKL